MALYNQSGGRQLSAKGKVVAKEVQRDKTRKRCIKCACGRSQKDAGCIAVVLPVLSFLLPYLSWIRLSITKYVEIIGQVGLLLAMINQDSEHINHPLAYIKVNAIP